MMSTTSPRGFTLLIAVVLSSVIVSISLALIDIAFKQVLLAAAAAQSTAAFYNADSALECALYWDQKVNAFDYNDPLSSTGISCANIPISDYAVTIPSTGVKRTIMTLPCVTSGSTGNITIEKTETGRTTVFANGYNTCDVSDPRRAERGLKATYGG